MVEHISETEREKVAEKEWLKAMLAYAAHLLSQVRDQIDVGMLTATTGPEDDPDRYNIDSLLHEIRRRHPEM